MSYANIHKIRPPRPKYNPPGQGENMGYVPRRVTNQQLADFKYQISQVRDKFGVIGVDMCQHLHSQLASVPPDAPPSSDVCSTAFGEWAFGEKVGGTVRWLDTFGSAIGSFYRCLFPKKPKPIEIRVYDFSESPSLCGSWKVD